MANLPNSRTWKVSTKQRNRARELRKNSTDAERLIWSALRVHRMNGVSFRRQAPIGPYVADFLCHAAKLVIELDGGQHFESEQEQRDARRDAFLASKGFRILHFNNHDVMTIETAFWKQSRLRLKSPLPNPPPQAAGEGTRRAAGRGSAPSRRTADSRPTISAE